MAGAMGDGHRRATRTFRWPSVLSVLFHVAFVVGLMHASAARRPPHTPAAAVAFSVVERPAAPQPPAPPPAPAPAVLPPAPPPPPRATARRHQRVTPPPVTEPRAAIASEPAPPPAGAPTPSAAIGASELALAPVAEGVPVGPAGLGGAGEGGTGSREVARAAAPRPSPPPPRPEEIMRYLMNVRARIDARKQYPIAGRRQGVEGEVRLRVRIRRDGRLVDQRVMSGRSELLSSAARDAVQRAAPFPPFPWSVGDDSLELVVPLIFELTD